MKSNTTSSSDITLTLILMDATKQRYAQNIISILCSYTYIVFVDFFQHGYLCYDEQIFNRVSFKDFNHHKIVNNKLQLAAETRHPASRLQALQIRPRISLAYLFTK